MTVEQTFTLPESALDVISGDAERVTAELRRHTYRTLAPDKVKTLREFTSAEAAELLSISPGNLRKMHSDGKIPDVTGGTPGRKMYRLAEIQAIREALAAQSRTPENTCPVVVTASP